MTSQGSPYARFRRALLTRNLTIIRSAAAELPFVNLPDALQICVVMRDADPDRYEAAAVRWIARFCVEHPDVTLAQVDAATTAFELLRTAPEAGLEQLQVLCAPRRAA